MFVFRNRRIDSGFTVHCLFFALPFLESETQRPDIGQMASRQRSCSRWYRGDWCAVFDSVSNIWIDLLFGFTAGKAVFLLSIYTGRIAQIWHIVIILFSYYNEGNLVRVCYSIFGRGITLTLVLIITDKCIKLEVHWKSDPNCTPRYKAQICIVGGRQVITFLKEYFLLQLGCSVEILYVFSFWRASNLVKP